MEFMAKKASGFIFEDASLARMEQTLRPWSSTLENQRKRARTVRYLRRRLGHLAEEAGPQGMGGAGMRQRSN